MSLLAYILITVAATPDVKFLLPDSGVSLPVLNVKLPLVGFFIVAPALIVIMHFNLLLNLLHHARKLKAWDDAVGDKKVLLPGFILNFGRMFEEKKTINYWLMHSLQIIILCFSPLVLLLFIQIRYAANHDVWMTAWHFVLVTLDLAILMIFWFRIIYPDLLDTKYDSIKVLFSFPPNYGKPHPAVSQSIRPWRRRFRAVMNWIVQGRAIPARTLWRFAKPARPVAPAYMPIFLMVFLVSLGCAAIIVQVRGGAYTEDHFYIPRINVAGETLMKKVPSDEIIDSYLARGKSKDEAWADFAEGITLSPGRDLQFADMHGCILSNAILNGVCLNGANLKAANLERDSLCSAELDRAILYSAKLNGSFLGSDELNGAGLSWAELNNADLSGAELNGADLSGAKLKGANLSSAELNGAYLGFAKLNGANLRDAELNGAHLFRAGLNGAYLDSAKLNGAYLFLAELNGAYLGSAELNGAYLISTRFRGSRLIDTSKARGAFILYGIDTVSSTDFDSLMVDSLKILTDYKRDLFLKRLDNARTYCNYVDPAIAGLHHDSAGFVEYSKKLACENTWTATGLLTRWIFDPAFTKFLQQSLIENISLHCPDSLPIIYDHIRNDPRAAFQSRFNKGLLRDIDSTSRSLSEKKSVANRAQHIGIVSDHCHRIIYR